MRAHSAAGSALARSTSPSATSVAFRCASPASRRALARELRLLLLLLALLFCRGGGHRALVSFVLKRLRATARTPSVRRPAGRSWCHRPKRGPATQPHAPTRARVPTRQARARLAAGAARGPSSCIHSRSHECAAKWPTSSFSTPCRARSTPRASSCGATSSRRGFSTSATTSSTSATPRAGSTRRGPPPSGTSPTCGRVGVQRQRHVRHSRHQGQQVRRVAHPHLERQGRDALLKAVLLDVGYGFDDGHGRLARRQERLPRREVPPGPPADELARHRQAEQRGRRRTGRQAEAMSKGSRFEWLLRALADPRYQDPMPEDESASELLLAAAASSAPPPKHPHPAAASSQPSRPRCQRPRSSRLGDRGRVRATRSARRCRRMRTPRSTSSSRPRRRRARARSRCRTTSSKRSPSSSSSRSAQGPSATRRRPTAASRRIVAASSRRITSSGPTRAPTRCAAGTRPT